MKILFFGDIVGKLGRQAVAEALPKLRTQYQPDVVIANVENATHGKGLNLNAYNFLSDLGIDVMTGGDHIFDVAEVEEVFSRSDTKLIRPANYPESKEISGTGYKILETPTGKLAVINLQGRVFMKEGLDNPFAIIDNLLDLSELKGLPIFIDFHTETTSEIIAMGWYLDGRVSAVVGTHTHVQTNDARVLSSGTAFISDAGMCGVIDSVLGVDKNIIIRKFLTGLPIKHELAEGSTFVNAVVVELDGTEAKSIEAIRLN